MIRVSNRLSQHCVNKKRPRNPLWFAAWRGGQLFDGTTSTGHDASRIMRCQAVPNTRSAIGVTTTFDRSCCKRLRDGHESIS